MEDTDCHGYCNTCFQIFKKNDEIIFFEELKDKYLSIEFCSELCLNTCLKIVSIFKKLQSCSWY